MSEGVQIMDTPTDNHTGINPLDIWLNSGNVTLSNNNKTFAFSGTTDSYADTTLYLPGSGKFHFEIVLDAFGGTASTGGLFINATARHTTGFTNYAYVYSGTLAGSHTARKYAGTANTGGGGGGGFAAAGGAGGSGVVIIRYKFQ